MNNEKKISDDDIKKIRELIKLIDPNNKIFNQPLNNNDTNKTDNEKQIKTQLKK